MHLEIGHTHNKIGLMLECSDTYLSVGHCRRLGTWAVGRERHVLSLGNGTVNTLASLGTRPSVAWSTHPSKHGEGKGSDPKGEMDPIKTEPLSHSHRSMRSSTVILDHLSYQPTSSFCWGGSSLCPWGLGGTLSLSI